MVTICCTAYNHEKFIGKAIEGFLIQETNFNVEILITDDLSTDKTSEILKKYEEENTSLKVIYNKQNQYSIGKKPLFNQLLPSAQGKYIALCEGDDYWTDPLKLQKQVSFLEKHKDYSLCFHNAKIIQEDFDLSHIFANLETREYKGKEVLEEWTIPTASVVFRKSDLVIENLINPNYLFGDIILFLTLCEEGKLYCINEVMSIYRKHSEGIVISGGKSLLRTKQFIKHHQEIKKNFGGKYCLIEEDILSKIFLSLSKKQLVDFNPKFLSSFFKAYKENKKIFFKNFLKVYLKVYLKA